MKNLLYILILPLILLLLIQPVESLADNPEKQRYEELISEIGIEEKLGEFVPLDLTFTNEEGREVALEEYFQDGKPVLLNLIYFTCPSICSLILNGVTDAMKDLRWSPGREFTVLTVSISHEEDYELAAMNKESYVKALGREEAADGWHFLTGTEEQIRALTDAVGFNFKWSDEAQEYLHGSGIMFLSPEGKISRYLYGVLYSELDIRNALFDAADGRVGSTMERIALYCFTYDPDSRSYVPYAMNIMKVGGAAVLLLLGLFLGIFWIKERRKPQSDIRLDA